MEHCCGLSPQIRYVQLLIVFVRLSINQSQPFHSRKYNELSHGLALRGLIGLALFPKELPVGTR